MPTVFSGQIYNVSSGGSDTGDIVQGADTLNVLWSGTINNAFDSGTVNVSSGGTAINTVVRSGGVENVFFSLGLRLIAPPYRAPPARPLIPSNDAQPERRNNIRSKLCKPAKRPKRHGRECSRPCRPIRFFCPPSAFSHGGRSCVLG
jgi:autotransporter passenger strand-loop-strand repeat protein